MTSSPPVQDKDQDQELDNILKFTLKGSSKMMYYIHFADFTETIFERYFIMDPLLLLFLSKNNFIKRF